MYEDGKGNVSLRTGAEAVSGFGLFALLCTFAIVLMPEEPAKVAVDTWPIEPHTGSVPGHRPVGRRGSLPPSARAGVIPVFRVSP